MGPRHHLVRRPRCAAGRVARPDPRAVQRQDQPARLPGRVTVPDIRGLFYSVCSPIAIRLGLRVAAVRLTEHLMPVDGLVVSQSPRPQSRARRGSTLTAQIWHPPAPR